MGKTGTAVCWQRGREFCRDGKVKITARTGDALSQEHLEGKVLCSFGFVHHPRMDVWEPGNGRVVTDYSCDCYEYSDGESFCSHCAALAVAAFGSEEMAVRRGGGQGRERKAPASFPIAPDQVKIEKAETSEESGDIRLAARVYESFGFVHHPRVRLDEAGDVKEYACDCYDADGSGRMCPHVRALLYKWKEKSGESAENPDEGEPDSGTPGEQCAEGSPEMAGEQTGNGGAAPRSMRILFGKNLDTGENLYWYPNDTERVLHTNIGIIGTMGTGKTQFTKSLVVQLCRQQRNNYDGHGLGILIFDYKGDYNETKPDFVRATGARILKPFRIPFNPFSLTDVKEKPQLPVHVANTFTDTIARIYNLGHRQSAALLRCIIRAYSERGILAPEPSTWDRLPPTFAQIYGIYDRDSEIRKNDSLCTVMEKLQQFEIFESDPGRTVSLFQLLRGVVVMDLSGYDPDIQNLIVAITLDLFYSQMKNQDSSRTDGRYRQLTKFILVDEADNFMSAGFDSFKKILKEGREFGVGTILSTQFLDHFCHREDDYSNYVLTWVVHRVDNLKRSEIEYIFRTDADGTRAEDLLSRVKSLGKHESIVKAGSEPAAAITDKPFYVIGTDTRESYLDPDGEETEE